MKKFLTWLFWAPIAVVLIALSVANRKVVTFSLDPVSTDDPLLSFDMPLFMLLFGAMLAGLLIGGVAAWLNQGKWRRAARDGTQRTSSQAPPQDFSSSQTAPMSNAPRLPSPGSN